MDNKSLSKNIRSAVLILFVTVVVLVASINSSSIFPWTVIGFIILAIGLPLQRSDTFLVFRGKILGILRRWDNLNEMEKSIRSFLWAIPFGYLVLWATKNPLLAGFVVVFELGDGMRHLQNWREPHEEEKL